MVRLRRHALGSELRRQHLHYRLLSRDIGLAGLGVAATIAILKYRLYDIDVVINKTVVYGLLAAFLTAVYVAIVVGIGTAFGSRSSRLLTVLAAVVMAVGFQPVRERARRFANRIVYGKRATPYRSSRISPNGRPGRTRPRTSFPGWPASWRRAPGPLGPRFGCGSGLSFGPPRRGRNRRARTAAPSDRRRRAPRVPWERPGVPGAASGGAARRPHADEARRANRSRRPRRSSFPIWPPRSD